MEQHRRIVQIIPGHMDTSGTNTVHDTGAEFIALADDGTLWMWHHSGGFACWKPLPDLPPNGEVKAAPLRGVEP